VPPADRGSWLLLAGTLITLLGSTAIEAALLLLLTPIATATLRWLALSGMIAVGVGIALMATGKRPRGRL
jgi:hypothetical protein